MAAGWSGRNFESQQRWKPYLNILKEMWEGGSTATEISAATGGEFSRNAVIGKAHRMGFKQPPKGISPKAPRNQPRKRVLVGAAVRNTVSWAVRTIRPARVETRVRPSVAVLDPKRVGIGIMALTATSCRAIIGNGSDGLALYCGDKIDRHSFCAGHCAMYFQPMEVRRKR